MLNTNDNNLKIIPHIQQLTSLGSELFSILVKMLRLTETAN